MRAKVIAAGILISAAAAFGQAGAPPAMKNMATSADVQALIARAKVEIKPGEMKSLPIVSLAPYSVGLEYRNGPVAPMLHEKQAELVYVIEGAGTLTVGGTLVGEKRTNATNLGGTAIQGGTDYALSKGDFFFIPEVTPHVWTPKSRPLVTMSLHLDRPLPGARQAPAPAAMKNMATSADVQALIARAKKEIKPGEPFKGYPIVGLAPYSVGLEYRPGSVPPAIHEKQAELFYVIQGKGTLTVGGTLVNEKRTNPTNLAGTAIQGGKSYSLSKGAFFFVPENTPHQWTPVGGSIVTMSLHLPRPLPAAQ